MINKYSSLNVAGTLKFVSLFLILMLASLTAGSYTFAVNQNQQSTLSGPSKVANDIINPGLDPMITLSSYEATLFAAANSTAEVKVTSNITWSASSDQSWLVVTPTSSTGNGTLTFTATANKGLARTAYVSVWATGVAVQKILITQSQEIPAVTFSSLSNGALSIYLQFNTAGTFYIDWGNGIQVPQTASTLGNTYSTASYNSGDIVKVYGSGITNLNAGSKNLTSLDITQCTDLTYLYLEHNSLNALDVSKNTKLTFMDCAYNSINSIDITNNTKLNSLSLGYNNLTTLDVSRNTALATLNCISNHLTSLDVRNCISLTALYCYNNNLITLDVSKNSLLDLLYCNSNEFKFTSLPQPKSYTSYTYAPQASISATVISNKVDLSDQLKATDRNGIQKTTVYTWYTKAGSLLAAGTDYTESNGVFTFLNTPSDSVYCALTNLAFPDFTGLNALRTVNLKVEVRKPVVETDHIDGIGTISAVGFGNITNLGIPNPASYGICWNTTGTPTTSDTKVDLGATSTLGLYSVNMTGLNPGTAYYVRAFATNIAGTAYGTVLTFKTVGIRPSVTTVSVTGIGVTAATVNGNITSLGVPNPTHYGVVWSTSASPEIKLSTKTDKGPASASGPFLSDISGLTPNTLYHARAYATNDLDTSYGADVIFTTLSPSITPPSQLSLSGFTTLIGAPSASQTFTIGGLLESDLVITAPTGYEVREKDLGNFGTSVSFTPVAGVVTTKTVEVRIAATAPKGTVAGTVVCASTGAAVQNVAVTGLVSLRQLTISDPTFTPTKNKVYDGTNLAAFTPGSLTGIVSGDDASLNLTTTTATYSDANAGTGKTITVSYKLTGANADKYLAPVDYITTGDITQAPLTVSAVADTKVYDGTVVSGIKPVAGTLITGDAINAEATQVFDNANAGTTHVLTASGLTIKKTSTGADVTANYNITYTTAVGIITPVPLTVTAATNTKPYDGTTVSAGIPAVGSLVPGDVVNVSPKQVFDNASVGSGHVLTASGLTIKKNSTGENVTANYNITYVTATGVITQATVTVTAIPDTKVYDGTTVSTKTPTVGSLVTGDAINVFPVQAFDNPTVGNNHVLAASGLTLKNANGDNVTANYIITYVTAVGVITQAPYTVTAAADTKVYDGTTVSTKTPTRTGTLQGGDVVTTEAIQVFDNANVGNAHILTPSGLIIKNGSGVDVTLNYNVRYATSTGVITPAPYTVNATAQTKVYDGTVASTPVPARAGTLINGDAINAEATQVFDNANAGTTHVLTASGLTIKKASTGADVTANYNITYTTAVGIITPAPLTVTAATNTKPYDGTTVSAGIPAVGSLVPGDVVNVSPKQVFDNASVGSGHVLTASGLTIKKNSTGENVTANYNITYVTATGVITQATVTVTAIPDTKVYDGTTVSAKTPTVGSLVTGDAINVFPVQAFDNPTVGNNHVLVASGLTLKNANGDNVTANYIITYVTAVGVITQAPYTVTAAVDTKVYDGTTVSTKTPTRTGTLQGGDVVTTEAIQVFDNANVGNAHVLTPSGLIIKNGSGVDVTLNYNVRYTTSTGVITPAPYTVNALPQTKVYDGTVASTPVPARAGTLITGDAINAEATQVFDNANAGTTHVLTASGLTIKKTSTGEDVTANYNITYNTAVGEIKQAALEVKAVAKPKIYDGTTLSDGIPAVGALVPGDVVNVNPIQVFDDANVSNARILTPSGLTIKKSSTGENVTANYNITYATAVSAITQATVTVTAVTDTKIYDGNVSSVGKPIVGTLAAGDTVNVAPIQKFDNIAVGDAHVMIASGLTLKKISTGENVTPNYNITYANSFTPGVILGKPLTASDPTITFSKRYDGSTAVTVTPGVLAGVDPGDVVVLQATAAYDNANTGKNKKITVTYSLSGPNAAIYAAPADFVVYTGEITAKPLIAATDPIIKTYKVYDGNRTAIVTPGVLSGILTGDNVYLGATATYDNATVGTKKVITCTYFLSGADAGNYTPPADYIELNGEITGKSLVVVSLKLTTSKVYDANTSATFSVSSMSGVEQVDSGKVELTGMATYENANAGTGKKILITYSISGTASGNYMAPANYTITNGVITPKLLTISDPTVVLDRMYDTTTNAVITALGTLSGVEPVDVNNVSVTAKADYNSPSIGTNKTITVVYTLGGTAMNNYSAPVNTVIPGAKISDNVTLSPFVSSVVGCEGSSIDLNYTVLTGTPTQYKITFGAKALESNIQNISYTDLLSLSSNGVITIPIPKGTKDGVYQGVLQMRNQLGFESPAYTFEFTINVSSDYIVSKFNDVVLCDNSSNRFTAYQWYKDGVELEGATKQFYCDPDGLIGSYYLKVTTTDGQTLFTCSKVLNIPVIKKVTVYPSPAKMNQTCTVKVAGMLDSELDGAEMSIYTTQGTCIYHSTKVEKLNSISLPPTVGMYVGRVTTSKGEEFSFKMMVVK